MFYEVFFDIKQSIIEYRFGNEYKQNRVLIGFLVLELHHRVINDNDLLDRKEL